MSKKDKKKPAIEQKIVVYAGSFDPFTWGHMEVVKGAINLFDKVIVAIGRSSSKKAVFDVEKRVELIRESCKGMVGVEVEAFDGLAVEYAKTIQACAMVRGLRSESDFSYEMPMAMANKKLCKDLWTVFIPTDPQFSFISSTIVKEIASYGANVDAMVPPPVARALKKFYRS